MSTGRRKPTSTQWDDHHLDHQSAAKSSTPTGLGGASVIGFFGLYNFWRGTFANWGEKDGGEEEHWRNMCGISNMQHGHICSWSSRLRKVFAKCCARRTEIKRNVEIPTSNMVILFACGRPDRERCLRSTRGRIGGLLASVTRFFPSPLQNRPVF